jgi:hypothetical protein
MEPFDPENDLIDRYLRGELHGKQLDTFMRKLENDPLLKKDVAFRQLLVKGIQEHGAVQLKNYLRTRTTQKRVMLISHRTWYYAAAAVALLLVSSTVVLWYGQSNKNAGSEMAKQDKVGPETENNGATHAPQAVPEPPSVQQYIPPILDDSDSMDNGTYAYNDDREIGTKNLSENKAEDIYSPYPDVVVIASNIPIIPIKVDSELDEQVVMRSSEAGKIVNPTAKDKKSTSARKPVSIDTAMAWDIASSAEMESIEEQTNRFKLSFVNTRDAVPQVQLSKTNNSNDLTVYNLPYDNPLILSYESKYYLKAGSRYYEINMNQSSKQNVTAVTDAAILSALNK